MTAIPVICDRCGLTGIAGLGDYSHLGDLLEFTPVPREVERVDGWSPDKQRAFIAALAVTGSRRRAAHALGMSAYGIVNLRKSKGADSFNAAYDRALAIAKTNGSMLLASEVADIAARTEVLKPPPSKLRDWEPEPEPQENTHELRLELVEKLVAKFQRKVGQEREARLAGQVVAADFYLRQITALEVAFDLMIDGQGDSGWEMLMQARRGELNMLEIADTYMARVLDQARRDHWAAMDDPERPELWPERYVIGTRAGDVRTEPLETLGKCARAPAGVDPEAWHLMSVDEQKRIWDEQHRRDAEAQIAWEAEAASQASAWRARQSTAGKTNDGD